MKITSLLPLLSAVLLAPVAAAQNLLANPGFESGGLTGWSSFGPNISAEFSNPPSVVPHTGSALCKMFGQFTGTFNVSGIFQSFPALPGQTYTMDCWSRHWSGDPLTGLGLPNDNWTIMKIAFFDVTHSEVGNAEAVILDGNFVTDVWTDNTPITAMAPPNTASVEALILFLQPGTAGGSLQVDDVELFGPPSMSMYPGTGEDLVLGSAVGGVFTTSGPGNDVKQAAGGSMLEFNVSSPGAAFDLSAYYLVAQLFSAGFPPVPQPAFPELWFDFSAFFVLVNGSPTVLGPPVIAPGAGSSTFYSAPMNFAGLSVIIQGLVINNSAANGLYAATNAHEIQFQ